MFVINRFNSRKWLLVGSLFGNCVFQGTFYSYQNYIYMAINRIFNGCMQVKIIGYIRYIFFIHYIIIFLTFSIINIIF